MTSLEKMLHQLDAGSAGIGEILSTVESARKDIQLARRKKYDESLIHEQTAGHAAKLAAQFDRIMDAELYRMEESEKRIKAVYDKNFEDHPGRAAEIERMKIKYEAMTPHELQEEANLYIGGASKKFDPVDLELLAGHVGRRVGDDHRNLLREKMLERDYENPWKRLIPPEDREYLDALRSRGTNEIVLKFQGEDGEKTVSRLSVKEALSLGDVI